MLLNKLKIDAVMVIADFLNSKISNIYFFLIRPQMIDFLMPESDRDKGENPIVDSLAVASEWTVVSKCALHGLIYVWDLKKTLDVGAKHIPKNEPVRVRIATKVC